MRADNGNEIRIGRIMGEMACVSLDAIPRLFQGIRNMVAQVSVRQERELMLRIRRRGLQSVRPVQGRSIESRTDRTHLS